MRKNCTIRSCSRLAATAGCRQTVVYASRTKQEIRVDCGKGAPQGDGTVRIEAMDWENVQFLQVGPRRMAPAR